MEGYVCLRLGENVTDYRFEKVRKRRYLHEDTDNRTYST